MSFDPLCSYPDLLTRTPRRCPDRLEAFWLRLVVLQEWDDRKQGIHSSTRLSYCRALMASEKYDEERETAETASITSEDGSEVTLVEETGDFWDESLPLSGSSFLHGIASDTPPSTPSTYSPSSPSYAEDDDDEGWEPDRYYPFDYKPESWEVEAQHRLEQRIGTALEDSLDLTIVGVCKEVSVIVKAVGARRWAIERVVNGCLVVYGCLRR